MTASTRWSVSGEPNRSSTVASAPSPSDDERVRERRPAVALAPVQHEDRVLDHDAVGNVHERAAREERVVQHRERVLGRTRRARRAASRTSSSSHVAMPHTRTPLASSPGSSSWCTTRPSRTTSIAGVLARLRRPRPAARCALVAGRAELGSASNGRYRSRSSSSMRL